MKIINIIENIDDSYGGPARSVPSLMSHFDDSHVTPMLLSVSSTGTCFNTLAQKNDLKVYIAKSVPPHVFRYSLNLENLFNKLVADNGSFVIHTHSLWNYTSYFSFKMSRKYGVPLVMSVRGNLYPWNLNQSYLKKQLSLKLFQMKMFTSADCIHATEINEARAVRNLGIKTPVAVIPNGVDTNEFDVSYMSKNHACKLLSLNSSRRYALFMSRIDVKKGIEFLISSFALLCDKYPDWDVLIVGPTYDAEYLNKLKQQVSSNGLEDRVHFVGMVNGLNRLAYYFCADLFVLPTHSENFGMVIGEALASKTPVITTTGTPWEALNSTDSGWCIELSHDNLTSALDEAFSCSFDTLKIKGENGYKYVTSNFSWESVSEKMTTLYSWLLDKSLECPDFVYMDKIE